MFKKQINSTPMSSFEELMKEYTKNAKEFSREENDKFVLEQYGIDHSKLPKHSINTIYRG